MVVLVGSQPSQWVSLLPFLGSLLLFFASLGATAAALYGVLRTSSAADRRDLNKWRRETLLRIAENIAQAAVDAQEKYGEVIDSEYEPSQEPFAEVETAVRAIHANLVRLQLIGANQPAELCDELHKRLNTTGGLGETIVELYDHEGKVFFAGLTSKSEGELHRARQIELGNKIHDSMLGIYSARDAFTEAVQRELARTDLPSPTAQKD